MFSVVIPLYNKERYIARSILSVIGQTYGNFELLVVDDGSTDGSLAAARAIDDPRIKILTKANGGESSARNHGIRHCTGDYIAFLDADDEWSPDFLQIIVGLIKKHPAASIFSTGFAIIGPNGRTEYRHIRETDCLVADYFRFAAKFSSITSSSVAVKRQVFDDIGLFNESLKRGPDLEMWFRINAKYAYAYSSRIGAHYHTEAEGRVCKEQREFNDAGIEAVNKIRKEYIGSIFQESMKHYIHSGFKWVCIEFVMAGENALARNKVRQYRNHGFMNFIQYIELVILTFFPLRFILKLKKKLLPSPGQTGV